MRNDLKGNYYLLSLERELKFDLKKYQNLIRPLEELENKSSDVIKEIDALYTVLGYIKDKCEKLSADLKCANSSPINHEYLGYTYQPKLYNVQGQVHVDHDVYYKGELFSFMPSDPENGLSFVGQKLFKNFVSHLDKIRKKRLEK